MRHTIVQTSRASETHVRADMQDRTSQIFAAQRGLITRRQALSLGMTDSAIGHLVNRGIWRRIRQGLYALNGTPEHWELEILGAVLLAGEPAWASHSSSAELCGYTSLGPGPIEVTTPLERHVRLVGIRSHRSGTIHDHDIRRIAGVPTLSAARTIVDLSSRLTTLELEHMVDDGLRRRVLTIAELNSVARRLPTIAPGRSPRAIEDVLRSRVAGYDPGDSELESAVLRIILLAGLPEPVRQHRAVIGAATYFIDLAYPTSKVAIEVDGYGFHSDRTTFDRDRRRQNDLVNAGWIVLRFTSRSTEAEIIDAVRQALFGRSYGV